jgi:hypothetical protein
MVILNLNLNNQIIEKIKEGTEKKMKKMIMIIFSLELELIMNKNIIIKHIS